MGHPAVGAAGRSDDAGLDGPRTLEVVPDVGTAAWIDCAGHLPWGLSGDQRLDDARSLTWDLAAPSAPVVGYPTLRVRVSASSPAASLSVKLCDVFPDGTSALVSRGTLDLAYRDDVHGAAVPLEPGAVYDVDVVLDACAYSWSPGQTLRVSIAGADWPNTVAPPGAGLADRPRGVADAAAARRLVPRAERSAPGRSIPRSRPRASAGSSTTTSWPGPRPRRRGRTPATPPRTTGPRASSTWARSPSTRARSRNGRTPTPSSS